MIIDIIKYPHPVLLKPCTAVHPSEFNSTWMEILRQNLTDTLMGTLNAAGLAANQIGTGKRVFIIKKKDVPVVYVNPEIFELKGNRVPIEEGCLSIPGVKGHVFRQSKVLALYWCPLRETMISELLTGFDARVFQHEMDHLNGEVSVNKMSCLDKDKYAAELEGFKVAINAWPK